VVASFFCDRPADDARFLCELRVRPLWQPDLEMPYVCHIDCLRKSAPARRIHA
jgi:hypothetical protein